MNQTFLSRFSLRDRRMMAILAAVSWAIYLLAFPFVYPLVKEQIVALASIPLAISGFSLGPRRGFLIGLANIALNLLLFRLAGRPDLVLASEWELRTAVALVVPVATGWFGDLYYQLQERSKELVLERTALRAEIAERQQAQQTLRQTVDAIETRVQERTAALRESEERYRVISEIMSDFAFSIRVEPDGKLATEWMAGAFNRITGYNAAEVADWLMLVHPADREATRSFFQPADSIKTGHDEFRIITKSGETRWIHAQVRRKPELTHGKIGHIYAAVQDITDHKRAEEALNESETRHRIISEMTADIAYGLRCEPDGTIAPEWFTGALGRLTGFSAEELHARGGLPGLTHPEDLPILLKHIQTHWS